MNRFLIETSHREQDCVSLGRLLHAQGHLTDFDWGCASGVHTGWAILEADNEAQARLAVPPPARAQARVVRVSEWDSTPGAEMRLDARTSSGLDVLSLHAAYPCWW
jgi:hypothetical protein